MSQALVSIVIPFYKGEKYLEKTIESILQQTYDNFELLIVNDGCPNASNVFFETIAQKDKRIIILNKSNGGVACARQYGIVHANGEFVAFCDQDDLWLPEKLAKQIPLFENPKVGLVYCGAVEDHIPMKVKLSLPFFDTYRGYIYPALIIKNQIVSCTAVARKLLLMEVEAFDKDIELMGVDDWLAWLKMSLVCEVDFVEEYLAVHIIHESNYSSNQEKMYRAEIVCLKKIMPIAAEAELKYEVNYQSIEMDIHLRYAEAFIHTGDFSKGGEVLLLASQLDENSCLKFKGEFFKWCPSFLLYLLQKIKRLK